MTDTPQPGRPTIGLDPSLPRYETIVHALAAAIEACPDRVALQSLDRALTYGQYGSAVAALAHRLIGLGAKGGRVVSLTGNGLEGAVGLMAGMAAGAQVSPMNPTYTERELAPLLADADPAVVLSDKANADRVRDIVHAAGIREVAVLGEGDLDLAALTGNGPDRLPEPFPSAADRSAMFFTGGTTGLPKAADHVHDEITAYMYATLMLWRMDFDTERMLNVAPLFHVWGFMKSVVMPLYLRGTVNILPAFKPDMVLAEMAAKRTTVFFGGPAALYVGLRACPDYGDTDLTTLKYCFAGGSPCPKALVEAWEAETGAPMIEGWGMSEGAPINLNPTHGPRKAGSCGVTCPETLIDIVDLESGDTVLPQGERGEIRLKGPQFCKRYRNRPEETAATFRDGWLYTGDIGYFDEDGYIWLVDRKKEMILVGGYNVYPREVDEVLAAHPAVMEVAAVGVPHDFHGETVKACVALRPGASAGESDLAAWCEERLVKYKRPSSFAFFDTLPKTGPGKIDKLTLKGQR